MKPRLANFFRDQPSLSAKGDALDMATRVVSSALLLAVAVLACRIALTY